MDVLGIRARVFLLVFFIVVYNLEGSFLKRPQVPCLFLFGDSLVDNGNNNYLRTASKANYLPYGIDFSQGPTGRFSNGQNIADFIALLLGFDDPIPPYASVQDKDILRGINYASGSSGILDETGQQLGDRIFLNKQLLNHGAIFSRIVTLLGSQAVAADHLSKCLYYFNIGSNDYLNNYFLPEYYNTSKLHDPEQYAAALIEQFSQELKVLYNLGSRKIAVSALHALGCIPAMTSRSPSGSLCIQSMNDAVDLFNDKLRLLVQNLNDEYADAKYVVIRSVNPPGVKFLDGRCCKVSNITGLCLRGEAPCAVRDLHLFFDNFHSTETANAVLGAAAYMDIVKVLNVATLV